jgi:hypothetical protein
LYYSLPPGRGSAHRHFDDPDPDEHLVIEESMELDEIMTRELIAAIGDLHVSGAVRAAFGRDIPVTLAPQDSHDPYPESNREATCPSSRNCASLTMARLARHVSHAIQSEEQISTKWLLRVGYSSLTAPFLRMEPMATIRGMLYHWVTADNVSRTAQINFARTGAVARTTLSTVGGGGRCSGGITQFRTRPSPNGADVEHAVDLFLGVPFVPIIAEDNMTSVTAVLDTRNATPEAGIMTLSVDLWS